MKPRFTTPPTYFLIMAFVFGWLAVVKAIAQDDTPWYLASLLFLALAFDAGFEYFDRRENHR